MLDFFWGFQLQRYARCLLKQSIESTWMLYPDMQGLSILSSCRKTDMEPAKGLSLDSCPLETGSVPVPCWLFPGCKGHHWPCWPY